MANDLVPSYMDTEVAAIDAQIDSIMSSVFSVPRISLRGRKFRINKDDQEIIKPADSMTGVILHADPPAGLFTKTYYVGAYAGGGNDAAKLPPTCSSSNGTTPDSWLANPQSDRCATCRQNQFGSKISPAGKQSKACRDSKRLWILPDADKTTVYMLQVPVTSLKNLSDLGTSIRKNLKDSRGNQIRAPLFGVRVLFEMADSEYPIVLFSIKDLLNEEEFTLTSGMVKNRVWEGGSSTDNATEW